MKECQLGSDDQVVGMLRKEQYVGIHMTGDSGHIFGNCILLALRLIYIYIYILSGISMVTSNSRCWNPRSVSSNRCEMAASLTDLV